MLETKIQELTAAVTQLTTAIEALRAQSVTTSVTSGTAATTTTVDAPKAKKAKAPKAEEPTPEPTPEPAPVAEVTLKDIRDAAQAALDAGKLNDVVALNKRFGLKRISDAPVDQYSAILAALKEINADGQA